MSAEEYAEWRVMFSAEELHPAADRQRHAELLAALANGPLQRRSRKMFTAQEFLRDPWKPIAPAARLTASQVAGQVASLNLTRRNRGRH